MLLCLKRNEVSIAVSPISPHVVVVVAVVVARVKKRRRQGNGWTHQRPDASAMQYAVSSNPKEMPKNDPYRKHK